MEIRAADCSSRDPYHDVVWMLYFGDWLVFDGHVEGLAFPDDGFHGIGCFGGRHVTLLAIDSRRSGLGCLVWGFYDGA